MSKCKKTRQGKNATRLSLESERKLLQQVGANESKLMTCFRALVEIIKFAYYLRPFIGEIITHLKNWYDDFM